MKATKTEQPVTNKTTGQVYQLGSQLVASLDGWELLAEESKQLPWYVASEEKKVKITGRHALGSCGYKRNLLE